MIARLQAAPGSGDARVKRVLNPGMAAPHISDDDLGLLALDRLYSWT
jgi:hypothetical protein